ncbi:hypothetical protein SAY87_028984 [Trapa incisa]|uniref:Uncharacterized protein n=1 Tax=Trapa incisa TaxID=236973 RepID=A0AAN7L2T7_9MYRT|nr:hypothetical protein SAY87_028984 [Trapa incisa]
MDWNSYGILDEQLEKEWLDGIQLRKRPRPKGVKRAPMTLEHRRRITEAIVAKWADPDYRERVFSGMAKYHGTDDQSERKPGRRTSSEMMSDMLTTWKKKTDLAESASNKCSIKQSTVWISNKSPYYDPLANSKLKMIQKIRSQRKASESEIAKAVERTSLLIAQAEKAAKALKFVAARSTAAQASLLQTIKLIAEAVELIKAVEARDISSSEGGTGFFSPDVYEKIKCSLEEQNQGSTVSGSHSLVSIDDINFDLGILTLQNVLNLKGQFTSSGSGELNMPSNGPRGSAHSDQEETTPRLVRIKKWVRGRYVEVVEESL